jgi:hypothetical protein
MRFDGMFYGYIEHLFFIARDGKFTRNACWEQATINDLATSSHDLRLLW